MAPRMTLEDLARMTGTSRQTVSNALNRPEVVRPDTRAKVLEAVRRTGYRPNQAARRLRIHESRLIALRLNPHHDGINGAILDRFVHQATVSASERGYHLALFAADDDAAEIRGFESLLSTQGPDGFLLTDTHARDTRVDWLLESGVPFVAFGRPWDNPGSPHSWVDIDGSAGTGQAVEHLLGRGRRKVGFLGWPSTSEAGGDRRQGWLEATGRLGARGPESIVPDQFSAARLAASKLLDEGADSVVCVSDTLAWGAAQAFGERGLSRDSVVGFDDTPVSRILGIASVSQPVERAAEWAVSELLRQMRGKRAAQRGKAPDPTDRQPRQRIFPASLPDAPHGRTTPPFLIQPTPMTGRRQP